MKCAFALLALLALVPFSSSASVGSKADKKVMVCYYGSWAVYRPEPGKFDVDEIDPFLCTHLVYGFAKLNEYTHEIEPYDPWNDVGDEWHRSAYRVFTGLKKQNPELKTLLAIGGWNEGSTKYSEMVANPASRAIFTQSVVDILREFDFDGLDFDWEYPGARGGAPEDKANFITMLEELKAAFRTEGKGWLLTAAVSPGKNTIDAAYEIREISRLLDHIHVMGYDYHGAWDPYTGHNAPLFTNPAIDKGEEAYFSEDYTINYFIQNGADPNKLVLGMPTYGRGFICDSAADTGFYAPARQGIPAGPYTREAGILGYNEICEKFAVENDWKVVVDNDFYKAPYAVNSQLHWIGYDDRESLKIKAEYAASKGILGAMVWSIETDDFHGTCHGVKFPLIKTIVETMNGPIVYPTPPTGGATTATPAPGGSTTPKATPPTTTRRTASTLPSGETCKAAGYYPDPKDCGKYYQCVSDGAGGWTIYYYECAKGTVFNDAIDQCDWPYNVPGCENYKP